MLIIINSTPSLRGSNPALSSLTSSTSVYQSLPDARHNADHFGTLKSKIENDQFSWNWPSSEWKDN